MIEAGENLDANLFCAQETAEPLMEVMSNGASVRGIYLALWSWDRHANSVHYEAVKGATIALTNMMAKAFVGSASNVHCIIPGYIRSARPSGIKEAISTELIDEIPPSSLGKISDVTNAVHFLASDESKLLTGQVLYVSREPI